MRTQRTDVVVVGAGPAGLATSHGLTRRGVHHVLLERGDVASSWRHQRWDALRLLTPTWMNRLPGDQAPVGDPDGYITAAELISHLERYHRIVAAPVVDHTTVLSVGETPEEMYRTLEFTLPHLPRDRPRYLMGVGRPIDLLEAIARGVDLFDCVMPTRNGRNALAFTDRG